MAVRDQYDGYRALGINGSAGTKLLSRRGNDLASRFPRVAEALADLPPNTMLDGEVVALDDDGRPSFKLLHRSATASERIVYYAFDVLVYAGQEVGARPLRDRRRLLETALANVGDVVRLSATLDASVERLVVAARDFGFEGVVAKRADSSYEAGERSGMWVECRVSPGQELVVGGYLPNGKTSFDALLVGYYEGRHLLFIAKIRNGFVPETRRKCSRECYRWQPKCARSTICPSRRTRAVVSR